MLSILVLAFLFSRVQPFLPQIHEYALSPGLGKCRQKKNKNICGNVHKRFNALGLFLAFGAVHGMTTANCCGSPGEN